jgi:serine/threonine protein kinase
MSDDTGKSNPEDTSRYQENTDPLGIIGWVIGTKYKIRSYMGGGGFGEVYEGYNTNLPDQKLVVKFFKRVQSRDKFAKEAKILCLLDHPNILRIIDFLPEEGAIIMPFIDGSDGGKILKDSGPLKEALYMKMARLMTDALAYAHERRIAHRDIKPGNILIDKGENVYLIDFGIAKEIKDSATKTAYVALTPMFAAPERQSGDQNYNPFLSDIYELGVTLFNFATNEMPYRMPSNPNINEWGGPTAKNLSPQLKRILRKATHPDPIERYQSANHLAEEFRKLDYVYARKSKSRLITIAAAIVILIAGGAVVKRIVTGPSTEGEKPEITVAQKGAETKPPIQEAVKPDVKPIETKPIIPADTKTIVQPAIETPQRDTIKPIEVAPQSQLPNLLVHIIPQYNVSLYIDGKEKSPDKIFEIQAGMHEVKIVHPDYPLLFDTLDISVDRNLEYNLGSRFAGTGSVTFRVGIIPSDIGNSNLSVSFNGKKRRYKNDELPVLDLKLLSGKWQIRFEIASSTVSSKIDSIVTFPYGGGPHIAVKGSGGLVDFGTAEWQGMESIDMVLYWSNR